MSPMVGILAFSTLLLLSPLALRADWLDPDQRDHALAHVGAAAMVTVAMHIWDTPQHKSHPWTCRIVEFSVAVLANTAYLLSNPHTNDEITERELAGALGAALPGVYSLKW